MNLIFVGSSRPEKIAQEYLKLGSRVNFAGMTLQNALLDGLYEHNHELNIVSAWDITPYPKIKQIIFQPENIDFKGRTDKYRFVGAINLPIINMIAKFLKTRKELKRKLKKNENNAVIVYETYSPFLLAAATLRKQINRLVVIVPDLPDYMHSEGNWLRTYFKNVNRKLINWCLSKTDGYILLSEPMLEKLPNKKYIVMEGIFNPEFEDKYVPKEKSKTIMYTGGIYTHRGTNILLDAFSKIKDSDYRLWIRGDGDLKSTILEMAKNDPRIKYFDPMGREALLELEKRATVLVNTTPPQDFTKYFFPSKNMEFLASGTPTVMFRLGCMPKEYDSYLFYADSDDTEALKNKLVEVCEMGAEEQLEFGNRAKQFILNRKNPSVQCDRIIEFIHQL
jgi:glycosyltransferase involved in cell wall biosynthesis